VIPIITWLGLFCLLGRTIAPHTAPDLLFHQGREVTTTMDARALERGRPRIAGTMGWRHPAGSQLVRRTLARRSASDSEDYRKNRHFRRPQNPGGDALSVTASTPSWSSRPGVRRCVRATSISLGDHRLAHSTSFSRIQ